MKIKSLVYLAAFLIPLASLSVNSYARTSVPIIDHNDVAITTGSSKPLTTEQVGTVISTAAATAKWEITKNASQDLLLATLRVRGKHTIMVSIPYSASKYSVRYESSINMNYQSQSEAYAPADPNGIGSEIGSGRGLIHPNYERWVQGLMLAIRTELLKA
jgi:hypothetical protein